MIDPIRQIQNNQILPSHLSSQKNGWVREKQQIISSSSQRRFRLETITQKNLLTLFKTQEEKFAEILEYARKNFPHSASLKNQNGFVYLDVDDRFIHELYEMLEMAGFEKPPYFRREDAAGAHITVFLEGENIFPADDLGQKFSFEVEDIQVIKNHKGDEYVIIQVRSPELEALREKYGLFPKVHGGHEFHISIAKKSFRKK